MKNFKMMFVGLLILLFSASMAAATTYTFNAGNLDNLEHGHYYTWGINLTVPNNETIVGASLLFNDIRNWQWERSYDLYVHLLDGAPANVTGYPDWQGGGDNFAGQGLFLAHYDKSDIPYWPNPAKDITYNFTDTDISTLMSYVADGNFGFGFDPDCHFYNNGVTFSIETAATPIPAPILLLGTGLIGMAGFRRRFRRG